jgi:biotin synthase
MKMEPPAMDTNVQDMQNTAHAPAYGDTAFHTTRPSADADVMRHDWTTDEIAALFARPFADLMYQAQTLHRRFFDPNQVQLSALLSIKTGGCAEDCKYCPQSAKYNTDVKAEKMIPGQEILEAAKAAKAQGATRFCMGAAWRKPKDHQIEALLPIIEDVKNLGMETCMTLGMLTDHQAQTLKSGGLDYYNHNIDTSEDYYSEIITTRTFQDRLDTLEHVRDAGLNVCSGGIIGMGETRLDRVNMLKSLATLPTHPGSVPINMLVKVEGTPVQTSPDVDGLEMVRTIAVARIVMPKSYVRLSAGREAMSDETQAMCFLAGANSIFFGDKLLTTENPQYEKDLALFEKLGISSCKG